MLISSKISFDVLAVLSMPALLKERTSSVLTY